MFNRDLIEIESFLQTGYIWTISGSITKEIRHVQQQASGGSYFAVFTLRFQSCPENIVTFQNLAPEKQIFKWLDTYQKDAVSDVETGISAIIEGIKEVLAEKTKIGTPIAGFKIEMTDFIYHPVDFKLREFKRAAMIAMNEVLKEENLVIKD